MHRRRRLGLRHRLRRPRPRPGHEPQRQRPRPRHRGLFQHGRPGLQVHADRFRRQVRLVRQEDLQEGPRPDGHELRLRLRRLGGHGRQHEPVPQGLPRGRILSRALAHHRLFAVHQPRHRHEQVPGRGEAGRGHGLLDPLPLQPAAGQGRQEPVPARFPASPSSNTTPSSRTRSATRRSSSSSPRSPRSCSPRPLWNRGNATQTTRRWPNRPARTIRKTREPGLPGFFCPGWKFLSDKGVPFIVISAPESPPGVSGR